MSRSAVGLLLLAAACSAPAPVRTVDNPPDLAGIRVAMDTWIQRMEARSYDSLASLVTEDFVFVMEGKRHTIAELVELVRGFGATAHKIDLANVTSHAEGGLGYMLYDAHEVVSTSSATVTVDETGSVIFRRDPQGWRFAQWSVSSLPRTTTQ